MIEWYLDLLHLFLNHRWSLQSDGLSAVRFVHESLLSFRSKSQSFSQLEESNTKAKLSISNRTATESGRWGSLELEPPSRAIVGNLVAGSYPSYL